MEDEEVKNDNINRETKVTNQCLEIINQMFYARTKNFEPLEIYMIKNLMSTLNLQTIS